LTCCSQFQARDKRDRQPSSVTFLTFTLICTLHIRFMWSPSKFLWFPNTWAAICVYQWSWPYFQKLCRS